MALAVIAGLGNPGPDYAKTRHNLGAVVVEHLQRDLGLSWKTEKATRCLVARGQFEGQAVALVRSTLYMNESGQALGAFARYHKLDPTAFVVVYDDITLALGRLRVTLRGSAGGHNGIADLLQHFGDGFVRFRLGIGSKPFPGMPLTDWVLGKFTDDESKLLAKRRESYLDALRLLWRVSPEQAMNQLNTRNSTSTQHEPNRNPTPLPGHIHSRPSQLQGTSRDRDRED